MFSLHTPGIDGYISLKRICNFSFLKSRWSDSSECFFSCWQEAADKGSRLIVNLYSALTQFALPGFGKREALPGSTGNRKFRTNQRGFKFVPK